MPLASTLLMLLALAGNPADGPNPSKRKSQVGPADHLARGKAAVEALEYEAAAEELTIASAHPDATLEQRIEANLFAGVAHRILGRDVDAKLNFVFVLRHAPTTTLPKGTAPKIRNFFDLIRLELQGADAGAPTARSRGDNPAEPKPDPGRRALADSDPDKRSLADSDPGGRALADSERPAVVAAAPPEPAISPALDGPTTAGPAPLSFIFPSVVLATGAAALVGGVGTALFFDSVLADPKTTIDEKEGATFGGWAAIGLAGVGVATTLLGAGLVTWTVLE